MQEPHAGRPEAAAAIWSWRESARGGAGQDDRGARRRGALQFAATLAVAAVFWLAGLRGFAFGALALGSVALLAALVSPRGLHAAIQRLVEATGRVVGTALAWILLTPVFYLFFAPFGLALRRGRRDRLQRRFDPAAQSYWEPHEGLLASSGALDRQY
jgi:hypothetical protein